jgi:hypothetical protein
MTFNFQNETTGIVQNNKVKLRKSKRIENH